jgi:FkbM family methyltransferase
MSLIYDVGMCDGEDTARYLALGHDVVAIEAIPRLCQAASLRFSEEISSGRLTILNVAIASEPGPVTLWVNKVKDGWSSLYQHLGTRIEGGDPITVEGVAFDTILAEHGIPWYLKVDIEGADHLCLKALFELDDKPEFISVEAAEPAWFWILHGLGYRRFALVDQAPFNANGDHPDLPESSGPLPDEIGEWTDIDTACQQFEAGKSWYDVYATW